MNQEYFLLLVFLSVTDLGENKGRNDDETHNNEYGKHAYTHSRQGLNKVVGGKGEAADISCRNNLRSGNYFTGGNGCWRNGEK